MTKPEPTKRMLRALKGLEVDRAPIWMMRQAGRYLPEYRETRAEAGDFLSLCYNPALACEVTLQPIRRFGFDASILFADILLIPHALGQEVWFEPGEGPRLTPLGTERDLVPLDPARVDGHMAPVYETVARLSKALPAETTLIGFAGAPWTVASYMIAGRGTPDQAPGRLFAMQQPQAMDRLLDLLVEGTTTYLLGQIKAGAEVIQLFDTWAGSLSPELFERLVLQPTKRIVGALKEAHPEVPVIGFPKGAGAGYERFIAETGVDAVSLDTAMPLAYAKERLQPKVIVQGNLDPLLLVAGGEALDKAVETRLDALGPQRYVFNLGHGITPQTPPEHVGRVVELVKARGKTAAA